MRVTCPPDRVGDALLARQLAQKGTPGRPSFNARVEQLRAFLHMNWEVLQQANTNLVNLSHGLNQVYGFCEPARYADREIPTLVGGEWFAAEADATDVGLKAEIRFTNCRRMQGIQVAYS